jgi:hypothetical protein
MDVCFLDIRYRSLNGETIVDEICILAVDDTIFKPQHYTFDNEDFCPECVMITIDEEMDIIPALFYVDDEPDGEKIKLLKKYFPKLRIVNFMNATKIKNYYCCFLKCLLLRSSYLTSL